MFVALQQNAFIKSNLNVTCSNIYLKFKNTKLNTNMVKHVKNISNYNYIIPRKRCNIFGIFIMNL